MLNKFQAAKRLISMCLVTLLLVSSTVLSFPAPAKAAGDVVIFKCETECGNMAAFTAGVVSGSAVTLAATGSGGGLAAAGMTAFGHAATTVAAPLVATAAPAVAAAAPIVVPVAATAAVGYVGYRFLENYQNTQAQLSK
jgi:hypothetical protein